MLQHDPTSIQRRSPLSWLAVLCAVLLPATSMANFSEQPLMCAVESARFDPAGWQEQRGKEVASVFNTSTGNMALLRLEYAKAKDRVGKRDAQLRAARDLATRLPANSTPETWRAATVALNVAEDNERRAKQERDVLRDAFDRACNFQSDLLTDLPRCREEAGKCMALSWKGRLPDYSKAITSEDRAVARLSEVARTSQERVNKVRGKLFAAVLSGDQTASRAQGLGPAALGSDGNPARLSFEAGFEARKAISEAQRASNVLVALSQAFAGQRGPDEAAAAWESWQAGLLIEAHLRHHAAALLP